MARIIYSALVESIRGSIAGTSFQRNAYGFTIKRKPNMVRPTKQGQVNSQFRLSRASSAWRSLSSGDRTAWNNFAELFPIPARLNPNSNLNGFNYFVKYHDLKLLAGQNIILDDPGVTAASLTVVEIEAIRSGSLFEINAGLNISSDNWYALVFLTSVIQPGQTFIHQTPRFIEATIVDDDLSINLATTYQNVYGSLPAVSDTVGVRLVFLQQTSGRIVISPATQVTIIS